MKTQLFSLAAAVLLLASCDNMTKSEADTKDTLADATADTAVVARTGETAAAAVSDAADNVNPENWDLDVNMPDLTPTYSEVKNPAVKVRGNDAYNIYDVDETVLFATDKSALQPSAKEALQEVAGSLKQRYDGKKIHVIGYTDSRAGKEYNKELGMERANAVKDWMVQNGNVAADNITVQSMGEMAPAASNATAAGRQENRRVEIAVATR